MSAGKGVPTSEVRVPFCETTGDERSGCLYAKRWPRSREVE